MNKQEIIIALEQERDELVKKLHSLEVTILTLKQSLAVSSSNGHAITKNYNNGAPKHQSDAAEVNPRYKGYYTANNNKQKAAAILKGEGRFLHMREFVAIAQSLEPNADPERLGKQIQQAVYALKNMEKSPVTSITVGNSNLNVFWGSTAWIDDKGNVKKEHMYDEKQITTSKGELIEI